MRLNVYLQKAGIGSRREAERLVAENRVAVNGQLATATVPVNEGDVVTVDGQTVAPETRGLPRLFVLHKPVDIICTTRDSEGRRTIFDMRALQDKNLPRLMNVGRLDINSEGLLLLTDDGPLAQVLMHPDTALSRVYRVRVHGRLSERDIAQIARGVEIDGIYYRGAEFDEEGDSYGKANSWYRVVLYEGKNREIRKLMEHFDCMVNRLIRVQYGRFTLGDLQAGEMREVPPSEVRALIDDLIAHGAKL